MTPRKRSNSWTRVVLPETGLAECVLELAKPLLDALGPSPSPHEVRATLSLTIEFWNASVLASKLRGRPRAKNLKELKERTAGRTTSGDDAATLALLERRFLEHKFDPRLVESWTYEAEPDGSFHLRCRVGLPEGVNVEVKPPLEKRVAIGGRFLDEVRIALTQTSALSFPVEAHRGAVSPDGGATVETKMPTALQLFAEGCIPPIGEGSVELTIEGRTLGRMVLVAVRASGNSLLHDSAELVFRPA